jgi:hypothetical protein
MTKTVLSLLIICSCGTLLQGLSFAQSSNPPLEQAPSDRLHVDSHAAGKNSPSRVLKEKRGNHPAQVQSGRQNKGERQLSNSQPKSAAGITPDRHQPDLSRAAGAVKPVPGPLASPLATKPLNLARTRSVGPAVVGGSASSSARNTAAVSGTGMKRKP